MNLSREPLAIRAAITVAVTAVLHMLVVLGFIGIDADQEASVAAAVDMVGALVLTIWGRSAVSPASEVMPEHAEEPDTEYPEVGIPASELIANHEAERNA